MGVAGALTDTGVDAHIGISMAFGDKGLATDQGIPPEETIFTGTKGRIKIHGPAHVPDKITVTRLKGREDFEDEFLQFDLPKPAASSTGFNYPRSEGFEYEAAAVMKCLEEGLLESPEYTLKESHWVAEIMDKARKDIGYVLPSEKKGQNGGGKKKKVRGH